jgi:ubiquinone/menaquinone biosynthesis C-methylase UbiE
MFSDPVKNIEQFSIKLGSSVADLGSGSGHYSLALARAVGDKGKVYAIDIQKDLLAKIKNEANHQGLFNVEVVWGDVEKINGTRIRSEFVDAVVISNLLFQAMQKEVLLKEAYRILKKDGVLLCVDWSDSFGGLGPKPDAVVSKDKARALIEATGFAFDREIQAGEHHYGFVFRKS